MLLFKLILPWLALSTSTFPEALADFAYDLMKSHNCFRKKHRSPPLELDDALSADCQKYAEELAVKGKLVHAQGLFGENLCYTSSKPIQCVKDWYAEIKHYDYKKPGFSMQTGHFTQLVWKASKILGVGLAKSEKGINFVVCRYRPSGNVKGEYQKNVLKGLSTRLTSWNCFNIFLLHFVIFVVPHLTSHFNYG